MSNNELLDYLTVMGLLKGVSKHSYYVKKFTDCELNLNNEIMKFIKLKLDTDDMFRLLGRIIEHSNEADIEDIVCACYDRIYYLNKYGLKIDMEDIYNIIDRSWDKNRQLRNHKITKTSRISLDDTYYDIYVDFNNNERKNVLNMYNTKNYLNNIINVHAIVFKNDSYEIVKDYMEYIDKFMNSDYEFMIYTRKN